MALSQHAANIELRFLPLFWLYKIIKLFFVEKIKIENYTSVNNCFNNKLPALLTGFHCFNFLGDLHQFPMAHKLLLLLDTPLENTEFQEFKYKGTKTSVVLCSYCAFFQKQLAVSSACANWCCHTLSQHVKSFSRYYKKKQILQQMKVSSHKANCVIHI